DTHTAVSSNRGSLMSWARAWMPTLPVPMAATLIAMASSSQVRDGQIEVGEGDAAVDFESLAGQVAAGGGGEIDGGSGDVLRIAEPAHRCHLLHGGAQFVVGGDDV